MKPAIQPANAPRALPHALAFALLLVVVVLLSWRLLSIAAIPGQPVESDLQGLTGLGDFRDVAYYPVIAVREGINPYDCGKEPLPDGLPRYRQRYPTLNLFPLYSPLLFVLYYPFSFFSYEVSGVIYVAANFLLAVLLAIVVLRLSRRNVHVASVSLLTALILVTNAGRSNFLGGENALPLALGTIGAVALSRTNPWTAGWLLALTSLKPTFGLPLGVLLLARGDWKTVLLGWGLGGAIGVAGLWIVFHNSGDLPRIVEVIRENQHVLESDPDVDARSSANRVDGASAIVRTLPASWTGNNPIGLFATLAIVVVACVGLVRWNRRALRDNRSEGGLNLEAARSSDSLICLAVVGCMYHLVYDALPLWLPIVWLLGTPDDQWPTLAPRWRRAIGWLAAIPMLNVFSTLAMRQVGDLIGLPEAFPQPMPEFCRTIAFTASGWSVLAAIFLLVAAGFQAETPSEQGAPVTRTG